MQGQLDPMEVQHLWNLKQDSGEWIMPIVPPESQGKQEGGRPRAAKMARASRSVTVELEAWLWTQNQGKGDGRGRLPSLGPLEG